MLKPKPGVQWIGLLLLLVTLLTCRQGKVVPTVQPSLTGEPVFTSALITSNVSIPPSSGTTTRYIAVGNRRRSYILHIPPTYSPKQPAPVVFIIHGGLGTAQGMIPITGFNTQSDKSGFIAVYPNGSGWLDDQFLTWNGGQCCGYAQQQNVDDIGFFRQLIKDLATIIRVDPKHINATGLSNGAMMSYRLACELADQIAAIAPVAGTQNIDACQPGQPVSVIHFHGTADSHAPYAGGVGSKSLTTLNHAPVEDTIAFWVKQNSCPAQPVREHSGHIIHDS